MFGYLDSQDHNGVLRAGYVSAYVILCVYRVGNVDEMRCVTPSPNPNALSTSMVHHCHVPFGRGTLS